MVTLSCGSSYAAAGFFPENFYLCKLTFCGLTLETMANALQAGRTGGPRRFWAQVAGPYRPGKIVFQNGGRLRSGLSRFRQPFRTAGRRQKASGLEEAASALESPPKVPVAPFRSMMAHDMKASLVLIGGFVERLSGREEIDPERRRRYLRTIGREGQRLAALLDDFLAHSETAEEPHPGFRFLALERELRAICEAHQLRAEQQGVVLSLECPPHVAPLPGDATGLQRAFANLLDNALKYSPPGGSIRVRVRDSGREVRISFADEGPGIEPEDLPHLFEAYYRGRGRNNTEGSGLGLATVQEIAAAHRGRVKVKNRRHRGAVFTMILTRLS